MPRRFKDSQGKEWEAQATPMMGRQEPGERIAMIGETPYHIRFTGEEPEDLHLRVVPPDVGLRFDELTDSELRELLEKEAGGGKVD